MNKQQVYNPYLPAWEYVPDGEPHLFDGRVYVYGSHDRAFGTKYCEGHYVAWSAPENDLSDWRCEGEIYRRTQDPTNARDEFQLWAPDVTRGPDGRYYLYYCFSFVPEIGVAVGDSPAGPFEFYGHVKYPPHIQGGGVLREFMPFDPAVLTDDDGRVYLYYGFCPACEKKLSFPDPDSMDIPEKDKEILRQKFKEIASIQFGEDGMCAELEGDMLTLKKPPHALIPGGHHTAGTGFEEHGFFEAASIRRIGDKYYFVYSSHKSHELCYAFSDKPTEGFSYGGTLVSNGDIGLNGRIAPVNVLGNNHGGMVCAAGQWYIFYHRQTNGTEYSRQGCAERLEMQADGSFRQVEITSCGLNGGPLRAEGSYPAAIACHVTDPSTMAHIDYGDSVLKRQTRITADPTCQRQYVTDIQDGSKLGYKYFDCKGVTGISIEMRGGFSGRVTVALDEDGAAVAGESAVLPHADCTALRVSIPDGKHALYFLFKGEGKGEFHSFSFEK